VEQLELAATAGLVNWQGQVLRPGKNGCYIYFLRSFARNRDMLCIVAIVGRIRFERQTAASVIARPLCTTQATQTRTPSSKACSRTRYLLEFRSLIACLDATCKGSINLTERQSDVSTPHFAEYHRCGVTLVTAI
jgi:hypothetical protein